MDIKPVNEALDRLLPLIRPLPKETISISESQGRVLSSQVSSRVTSPIADLSAVDGYAVHMADVEQMPVTLPIAGKSSASKPYAAPLQHGQAVQVSAGSRLPEGTEAIIPDALCEVGSAADLVTFKTNVVEGSNVCFSGLDFAEGETCLKPGQVMNPRTICVAAAMNIPWLVVNHRPRIALFTCGDELVMPGEMSASRVTFASTNVALAAYIHHWGGIPINLGLCGDDVQAISRMGEAATGIDLLITTGGLSESANDAMQKGLRAAGYSLERMIVDVGRPSPLLIGQRDAHPVLSLPGSPISCLLFINLLLRPAMRAMHGMPPVSPVVHTAQLDRDLDVNDLQQNYLRASLNANNNGQRTVNPVSSQDNMLLSAFNEADCLVVVNQQATQRGDMVQVISLNADLASY